MDSEVKDGERTHPTPEFHYEGGLQCLSQSLDYPKGSSERTNELLNAIAHVLMGGLRDGLDYAAKQADRVEPGSPIYPGPEFEEDTTRP